MEGGMRVPCVVRWPGKIPAGKTCDALATTMDLLPTFARLAGTEPPRDRVIDGEDIWPLLAGRPGAVSPHKVFYYYHIEQLQAVRSGNWKLHLARLAPRRKGRASKREIPARLYDLKADIGETVNLAEKHPEVVKRLMALAQQAREDLGDLGREGRGQRAAAVVDRAKPLVLPTK